MKSLYSESEEEEDELITTASIEPTEANREKGRASTSGGGVEEFVVEEVVE